MVGKETSLYQKECARAQAGVWGGQPPPSRAPPDLCASTHRVSPGLAPDYNHINENNLESPSNATRARFTCLFVKWERAKLAFPKRNARFPPKISSKEGWHDQLCLVRSINELFFKTFAPRLFLRSASDWLSPFKCSKPIG